MRIRKKQIEYFQFKSVYGLFLIIFSFAGNKLKYDFIILLFITNQRISKRCNTKTAVFINGIIGYQKNELGLS